MQKIWLLIIGIILIILSFSLDFLGIFRLIILIIGILLIDMQITKNYPKSKILLLFLPIFLLIVAFGLDILLVANFNKVPVFSYEIKSSEKVSTYNSFFYRAFSCNHKIIMDYGYQKNYVCDNNDLETHDVNAFLGETIASFHEYQHKFVKLQGKISKISGVNILELSPYKEDAKNTLNGYVEFNTEYVVRINTESDLSQFRIYDEVTVIGLVSKLTKDSATIIDLNNTVIIPSDIYDNYSLEIIENDSKEITNYVEKKNVFLLGLNDIYVHYDENHIYELKYLITDERIKVNDLIKDTNPEEIKDEEENIIGNYYKFSKFNIISCQNNKTILINKNLNINKDYCQ